MNSTPSLMKTVIRLVSVLMRYIVSLTVLSLELDPWERMKALACSLAHIFSRSAAKALRMQNQERLV